MKLSTKLMSLVLAASTAVSVLTTGTSLPFAASSPGEEIVQETGDDASITVSEADMSVYATQGLMLSANAAGSRSGVDQNANPPTSGAEFTIKFYAGKNDYTAAPTGTPTRRWVIRTDEDGSARLDDGWLVGGDQLYRDDQGVVVVPLGCITIQETKAPEGYKLDGVWKSVNTGSVISDKVIFANVVQNGEGADFVWGGSAGSIVGNNALFAQFAINDTVYQGGLKITKSDADLGGAGQGASKIGSFSFEVRNTNSYSVSVADPSIDNPRPEQYATYGPGAVIYRGQTDNAGNWQSPLKWLPYGQYELEETAAPEGYELNDHNTYGFAITEETDGQLVTIALRDPVERGALEIHKGDNERARFYTVYHTGQDDHTESGNEAANIPQGNASLSGAVYRIRYMRTERNRYPIVIGGKTYQPGSVIDYKLVTDEHGWSGTPHCYLPLGDYEVFEEKAAQGMLVNQATLDSFHIVDPEHGYESRGWGEGVTDEVIRGGIEFTKWDNDFRRATAQGDATLAGAKYTIVNTSAQSVWVFDKDLNDPQTGNFREVMPGQVAFTMTTDANGHFSLPANTLPFGNYEFKEISPSTGYLINPTVYHFDIIADGTIVKIADNGHSTENVIRGGFEVQKRDSDTKGTVAQGDATLGAFRFEVTNLSPGPVWVNGREYASGAVCLTGTADANGHYKSANNLLPYGTYKFKEVTPPVGYSSGKNIEFTFSVRKNNEILNKTDSISNPVQRYGMIIVKRDIESKQTAGLGGATLAGGEFKLYNKSNHFVVINGTTYNPGDLIWTFTSDENGRIGNEISVEQNGKLITVPSGTLPYGTYRIVETVAPEGYFNEGVIDYTFSVVDNGRTAVINGQRESLKGDGSIIDLSLEKYSMQNQVVRGDFSIRKIDGETQRLMAGVRFRVTSLTTGESHEFVTNENGGFRSSSRFNPHSQDTNGGRVNSGMWFGQYMDGETVKYTEVNDDLGALPFDTYFIEELRCPANEGYTLWSDVFTITRAQEHGDDYEVNLNNIENFKYKLTSKAFNTEDKSKVIPALDEVSITDTVTYDYLTVGKEYTLMSMLYNATTGEPLKDAEGNAITQTNAFIPEYPSGDYDVVFFFDARGIEGGEVVVYQFLYETEGLVPVAKENNPDNDDQTVTIPSISTAAIETSTGYGVVGPNNTITIEDTIFYAGVQSGYRYTVEGVLYDRGTGLPYLDENGNTVTSRKTFRAHSSDGYETVRFTLSGKGLEGRELVVFETLYLYNSPDEYCYHRNINDVRQTVYIPAISGTTAADANGIKNVVINKNEDGTASAAVRDTVNYTDIRAGLNYRVNGTLHDVTTGEDVTGGAALFVPTEEEGSVDVEFNFDPTGLEGHILVVYEEIFVEATNGEFKLVAEHKDDGDLEQRVYVPKISTSLNDSESKTHVSMRDGDVTLIDTVTYEALAPNTTYTLNGILVDRETGKPVIGMYMNTVTAEAEFTTGSEPSGTADITFNFSGTFLNSNAVVAFEELYQGNIFLTEHKDTEDENQLVRFPAIATSLVDDKTGNQITNAAKGAALTDTVTYENLVPGAEYVVEGQLVDQMNSARLAVGKTTFTPTETSGTIEVKFTVDASKIADHTLVAFETLKANGAVVAEHKDINDDAQMSHVPSVETSAIVGKQYDYIPPAPAVPDPSMENWITVKSTVKYHNLVPGREYTITSTLTDSKTGELILDANGNEITATTVIVPETSDGETELTYTFEAPVDFEQEDVEEEFSGYIYYELAETTKNIYGDKGAVIIDTIEYTNLIPGLEYIVNGTLMDKATGNPVLDPEGNAVTASKTFVPSVANGSVDVEFMLDANANYGKTLVVFEELTLDGAIVAEHKDLSDVNQTLYVPELDTVAVDGKTKLHMAQQCSEMFITDTVTYSALEAGKTYTVRGTLMDKDTKQALTDNSGNPITVEQEFLAQTSKGSVTLEFHFENYDLAGRTIVVFEELIENDFTIAVHNDFEDEDQTVYIPKITTDLVDSNTGKKITYAEDGAVVVDTITYSNLIAGMPYQVRGQLVDAETGESVASTQFVFRAPTSAGTVDVEYTFDASKFAGRSIVAYEELWAQCSYVVARHADISDAAQTTHVPGISTVASNTNSGTKSIESDRNAAIQDVLAYTNLLPGETYTVTSVLMDAETGKALTDAITASFRATSANGNVKLTFNLDTTELIGHSIVLFETVSLDGGVVARHEDMNDADQTVYVLGIDTVAVDGKTGLHMAQQCSGMTITDTVTYAGLEANKPYTLIGTLMDKDTKQALTDNDGNPIVVEKDFTASTSRGSVAVEFAFENFDLSGHTIVVFEELLDSEGNVLGEHKDYEDTDQTVYIPKIQTSLSDDNTGRRITLISDSAIVTDTIIYTNLMPGIIYKAEGELVDAMTGKPVATSETVFRAENANGTVDVSYTFDASDMGGRSVVAYEEVYAYCKDLVGRHADIADPAQTTRIPVISTVASDGEGGRNIRADAKSAMQDVITYTNLIPNETYNVTCKMVDAKTGEQLGEDVSVTFTAPSANGKATLDFTANTLSMAGRTIVLFETISLNGKTVAEHNDLSDLNQTLYVPALETEAADASTGLHYVNGTANTRIKDTVTYEGLEAGKAYTMVGHLVNKLTGDQVSEDVEVQFEAKSDSGEVTVVIPFDGSAHTGETLVAVETLKEGDKAIAEHNDVNDEAQTIYIPKISTVATDAVTGGHMSFADDKMTLVDKVTMSNLQAGADYELITVLVNRTSSEIVAVEGADSIVNKFTAEAADVVYDVSVVLEDYDLAGSDLVFYEYLRLVTPDGNVDIASHADTYDADQTVKVPMITTSAIDVITGTHQSAATGDTVVVDTVSYSHLIAGETYTIEGTLMNKGTGEALLDKNGKPVTATAEFVAEAEEGTAPVEFEVNVTGVLGETLVCYETLKWNGNTVAVHHDIDDADQTIYVPRITTYLHIDEDKSSGVGGTITIVDDIYYYNLLPGYTYRVNGTLMDKATGEARLDRYGNPYTGSVEFVADDDGTGVAYVEFVVDTNDMADGAVLVAFEKLQIVFTAENDMAGTMMAVLNADGEEIAASSDVTVLMSVKSDSKVPVIGENPGVPVEPTKPVETPDVPGNSDDNSDSTSEPTVSEDTSSDANVSEDTSKPDDVSKPEDTSKPDDTEKPEDKPSTPSKPGVGIVDDEDIDNEGETVVIKKADIDTVAVADDGSKKIYAVSDATIIDNISYKNLRVGEEYTFVGTLMNWADQSPVLDADGNPVTSTVKFTADVSDGSIPMMFNFDSTVVNGGKVVVFQQLYHGDDLLIALDDWFDADETIDVELAYLRTEAKINDNKSVNAGEFVTIEDTVSYTGLKPGTEYTLKGELRDWKTGKPMGITAQTTFTTEGGEGSAVVKFVIDTTGMANATIVAFEDLYHGDSIVAFHRDINDAMQSIYVTEAPAKAPTLDTELMCVRGRHEVYAQVLNLIDTLTYTGLEAGKTYTVDSKLVIKSTGEEIFVQSTEFTPEAADGKFDVVFEGVDLSDHIDEYVVAMEVIKSVVDGDVIDGSGSEVDTSEPAVSDAETSEDSSSENVSSDVEVSDSEANENVSDENISDDADVSNVSNEDSVSEETVSDMAVSAGLGDGCVVDDEDCDDGDVSGPSEPEKPEIPAPKFEIVVSHEDIEDTMQTVHTNAVDDPIPDPVGTVIVKYITEDGTVLEGPTDVLRDVAVGTGYVTEKKAFEGYTFVGMGDGSAGPKGIVPEGTIEVIYVYRDGDGSAPVIESTELKDANVNDHQAMYATVTKFIDTVNYKGLTAGTEYTIVGSLVNKATGDVIMDKTMTFVPERASGSVNVEFERVDTTKLQGATVVAFEKIILGDDIIAVHQDADDAMQTVYVGAVDTVLTGSDGIAKSVDLGSGVKVVDTVKYENLVPGKTYSVAAYLRDRAANDSMYVAMKNVTFTPDKASGTFEVVFEIDTTQLAKHELVATENIYLNNVVVADHSDMNDADQTVAVQSKANPFTGIANNAGYIAVGFAGVSVLLLVAYVIINKRSKSAK